MILGIDPGWSSLGIAVVDDSGNLRNHKSMIPKDHGTPFNAISKLWQLAKQVSTPGPEPQEITFSEVYIERYVTYGGITTDPEKILMMIGALQYSCEQLGINIHMVRAIDWKPEVCKYLVRTLGFSNPYPAFDKRYSILAAQSLSGFTCKSDHEADAICLAYLDKIRKYYETKSR